MRITDGYLDQVREEIRRLCRQASAADRSGDESEAARLRREITAREVKLGRLQTERTNGVRFA
jgi:hypothetical protein